MAIEYKDYYEILGLPIGAGDDEVRLAFRRLARQFHPDITGNDRQAEDRFKEINEAYEVLGDPAKRQRYDDFMGRWRSGSEADAAWQNFTRPRAEGPHAPRRHYNLDGRGFSEFFQEMFGRENQTRRERPIERPSVIDEEDPLDQKGDDLESDLWVSLNEVAKGAVRTIALRRAVKCPACHGMGQVNTHPCERCDGKGSVAREDECKVKVPRGVQEGALLRVTGRGEPGAGGPPGDLYLKVHYSRHPDFRVENGTLRQDLELAPWEAVLGGVVPVATLDGRTTIRIPEGTRNGSKLRLKGRGLPAADGTIGDLMVRVVVQVPGQPSQSERRLWEQLAKESTFRPRES